MWSESTIDTTYVYKAKHIMKYMGLSENSVPLHPMVNDHYPY